MSDARSHPAPAPSSAPHSLTRPGLFGALRVVGRTLWHLPDRLLHPLRRRSVIAGLRRERAASVLLVCHGNVMRSPYAEAVLRRLLGAGSRARVATAGFIGPDRPAHPAAVEGAASRGVDLAGHRSRLVSPEILRDVDLVVVMNAQQRRALRRQFGVDGRMVIVLGDLDPRAVVTRAIEDPIGRPPEILDLVYARIDRCLATLARELPEPDAADVPQHNPTSDTSGSV